MSNSFKRLFWLLIGCLGIGFVIAIPAFVPAQGSNIIIDQPDYNFGELSEMAPLSHAFIVKNSGKAILNITDVQPS